ncbi:hypothetical protein [Nocardia cyriacigeorgica]|uniref:hypothetical protein n=1 Tax=Nocardia cyriacigeorgica TaxID=135487 RepID=UPI0006623BC5
MTFGVWTYPGSDSCSGGAFVDGVDMRPLDPALRTQMTADVLALRPNGDTPTAPALRAAADELSKRHYAAATIILVSDGESTCGGDPCVAVKDIVASGVDLTVHTVGFELSGEGRDQLKCIADATGGGYHDAQHGGELIKTTSAITTRSLEVSVRAPAKVIGGGVAPMKVSVRNVSLTETATDVHVTLGFIEHSEMFRRIAPPVVRLGNLLPGKSAEHIWKLPVATTENQVEARYLFLAASGSGAYGTHERTLTVVRRGAYNDVAGGLLAALLKDPATKVGVFGDSYASGEGAGNYSPGNEHIDRRCHRSEHTHVAQLFGPGRTHIFACSGAVQHHLFAPNASSMPTMSQVEEMSRTDVVLDAAFVSIGGNDMGFGALVTECVLPNEIIIPSARPAPPVVLDTECGKQDVSANGVSIGEQVTTRRVADALAALTTQLPKTYRQLYDAVNAGQSVAERGHEAPLFVLGYPKVFPEVVGIGCGEFAPREVTFANKLVKHLNRTLQSAVNTAREGGRSI